MKITLTSIACSLLILNTVQADTGNINIYGKLRVGVEMINGAGLSSGKNGTQQIRVVDNASVFGFKGVEDLGSGISLNWKAIAIVMASSIAAIRLWPSNRPQAHFFSANMIAPTN